jgi:hypothetical protein
MYSYIFLLFLPPFLSHLLCFLGANRSTTFPAPQDAFFWKKSTRSTLLLNFGKFFSIFKSTNILC